MLARLLYASGDLGGRGTTDLGAPVLMCRVLLMLLLVTVSAFRLIGGAVVASFKAGTVTSAMMDRMLAGLRSGTLHLRSGM